MTYYRKWLAGQLEWAEELRQRQWELLGSYAVQALISAGVAALACWLISHWMREAWAVALVFLAVILCLLLRQVLIRLPLLTQNGYRRKIRRALAFLDPAGREQFAQDQLEAEQQLDRQIDLVMTGYGQNQMPAQLTLGRRYLFMVGGDDYGPVVIDLLRVTRIRPAQRQKKLPPGFRALKEMLGESTEDQQFLLYFENQANPVLTEQAALEGMLTFGCLEDRRQALALLRYHFKGEIWLNETQRGPNLRILR